ncbi:MAG: endonuclease MutS2, partial [Candidatus Poribacteria bacterium]
MNQHTLDVLEYGKVKELLVSYATSGLGKNLAQRIRPLTDVNRIEQLIAETTELKSLLSPNLRLPLGGLHDLFPIMEKLDKGEEILLSEEIILIKETLRAGRIVKGYLQNTTEDYPNLRRFAHAINTYPTIEEKIEKTFDDGGVMRNSASPALKSIRNQIQILRGRIRTRLQSVIRAKGINPYLQDTVVRERKGRPVLAVKERHADRVTGAIRDKSDSGNSLFIEPEAVLSMGNELQELMNAEKAEMVKIIREITAMIADKTETLRKTLKVLAHIDLTYAKVCFSRDYEMNPPLLNTDGVIDVNGARHPLLLALQREASESDEPDKVAEVSIHSFGALNPRVVPIDFRLGDDFNTLIITGPNTGGKTVTLKTVGLLTLMAQSGMHVPATGNPKLAVFRRVSADIGDEQSIEQSLSTFSSHLTNIAGILQNVDENSLVLLDELGGGTDPSEGAALGKSIMEYLHKRNAKTVVTTHISPLKNLGYTVPGIENASVEFDLATLQPTYKLLIGTPGSSNALAIAQRLGLPSEVIESAATSSAKEDEDVAELINQLQSAKIIAGENKRAAEASRTATPQLEQEYRMKLQKLAEQEKRLQKQLHEDAFAALRKIKGQIARIRSSRLSSQSILNSIDEIYEDLSEQLEE